MEGKLGISRPNQKPSLPLARLTGWRLHFGLFAYGSNPFVAPPSRAIRPRIPNGPRDLPSRVYCKINRTRFPAISSKRYRNSIASCDFGDQARIAHCISGTWMLSWLREKEEKSPPHQPLEQDEEQKAGKIFLWKAIEENARKNPVFIRSNSPNSYFGAQRRECHAQPPTLFA